MKAIEINGEIKTYPNLPSSWENIIGGFNNLSNEEAQTFGFYDVTTPAFDDRVQELGDIYFDQENNNVIQYKECDFNEIKDSNYYYNIFTNPLVITEVHQ